MHYVKISSIMERGEGRPAVQIEQMDRKTQRALQKAEREESEEQERREKRAKAEEFRATHSRTSSTKQNQIHEMDNNSRYNHIRKGSKHAKSRPLFAPRSRG